MAVLKHGCAGKNPVILAKSPSQTLAGQDYPVADFIVIGALYRALEALRMKTKAAA